MMQRKNTNSDVYLPPLRQLSVLQKQISINRKVVRDELPVNSKVALLDSRTEFLKSRNNEYLKLYQDLRSTLENTKVDPEGTLSEVYKELSRYLEDFNGKVNRHVSEKEKKLAAKYDIRLAELKNTREKGTYRAFNSFESASERENNLKSELNLLKTSTDAVEQRNLFLEQHNKQLQNELDTAKTQREGLQKLLFDIKAAETKPKKPILMFSRGLPTVQIKKCKVPKDIGTERYLGIIRRLQRQLQKERSEKELIKRKCLQVKNPIDSFSDTNFKSLTERSRLS